MSNEVKEMNWEDYLRLNIDLFDMSLVESFERDFNIKFPEEYCVLLLSYQGKNPEDDLMHVGKTIREVGPLFYFGTKKEEKYRSYEMRFMMDSMDGYPETLIPFIGAGGSGSCFAFDFSKSPEPSVVFVNADFEPTDEKAVREVAPSISQFLKSLMSEDEAGM